MDNTKEKDNIPHIKVSVEYNGEEASQYCAHFIDAIYFLCQCEALIRRNNRIQETVDVRTSQLQKLNLDRLMNEANKRSDL